MPPNIAGGEPLPDDMRRRFEEIIRRGVLAWHPEELGQDTVAQHPAPDAAPAPADPTVAPRRQVPAAGRPAGGPARSQPDEAFARIRLALAQNVSSTAAVVDLGDMLTTDPGRYAGDERQALMVLHKCTLEAAVIASGRCAGFRNTLVIVAADLKRVPEWLYRENPYIAIVQASRPNKEERKQFAMAYLRPTHGQPYSGFYGGDQIGDVVQEGQALTELEQVADEFADLTDGLHAIDLNSLRHTSWQHRIPVGLKRMHRLVDFFKFGLRDDPWQHLSRDRVAQAQDILSRRVIGQPHAVEAVTSMLTSARVGLSMAGPTSGGRPKGVFFFVGPTGVGKTELAKAVTELVFGDERAFARFDMSEYKEEHAAEKLAGAPPGFVGYEEGGQLTNRVMERPHSILLFDEIEKAHPKVLDKFLQILEDGRLTDGKGQTAYFHQTAIIFTSNIGASDLADPHTGAIIRPGIMRVVQEQGADAFTFEQVRQHFLEEVRWFFTTRIGRAELLNRFGDNIVAFDLLRPDYVDGIARKFLKLLADASQDTYRCTLRFDDSIIDAVRARMQEGDNLLYGGRRIKALLETMLERPLNRWVFTTYEDPAAMAGRTFDIRITPEGALEVTDAES
ncbi:MAG: AAA domain-containing protein [Chthonomonadales bacterium]|nr:AAA domain-containing protein [Chthonomonadales bacterium]